MPIIDEIGITLTIDENRLVPDLTSNYLEMEPGHVYDVQLSATETSRVESPYTSKCQNDYPATCPSSGAYTMTRCSQGCVDYHINKACNCSDHSMTKPDLEHVYKTKNFCQQQSECITNLWHSLGTEGMEELVVKPCTPECQKLKYSVSLHLQKIL